MPFVPAVDMLTAVHAAEPAKEGPSCPVGQAGGAEAGFAPAEQALCLVFLVDGSGAVRVGGCLTGTVCRACTA